MLSYKVASESSIWHFLPYCQFLWLLIVGTDRSKSSGIIFKGIFGKNVTYILSFQVDQSITHNMKKKIERNIFMRHDCVYLGDEADAPQAPRALEDDPTTFYTARVDIKKFAQFLIGEQVNPVRVICSEYYYVYTV